VSTYVSSPSPATCVVASESGPVSERVTVALALTVTAPRQARRVLDGALAEWGLGHLAEAADLLTSELVTNAVLHGAEPASLTIYTDREADGGLLFIEVDDANPDTPDLRGTDENAESGRGLMIVEAVAEDWGCDLTEAGKRVWASLAIGSAQVSGRKYILDAMIGRCVITEERARAARGRSGATVHSRPSLASHQTSDHAMAESGTLACVSDIDRLPAIRTAHYPDADSGGLRGEAVCRAGHTLALPDPEYVDWVYEHATCEALRWLGEANCVQAFALLGWEHSTFELDHSQIRGLGPGGDMTARPGDRLIPDGAGWFYPMAEDEYQRVAHA
jgi:anti-sigma regulatory factor (Ser/Thr protein kinase)